MLRHRRRRHDAPRELEPVEHRLHVLRRTQVVRRDLWRGVRLVAPKRDLPAALGQQIAGMQRHAVARRGGAAMIDQQRRQEMEL